MTLQGLAVFGAYALHVLVVTAIGLRVIWVRRPAGTAFAWLLLAALLPGVGAALYVLFGERPIGRKRIARSHAFYADLKQWMSTAWKDDVPDASRLGARAAGLSGLAQAAGGMPLLAGNTLELVGGAQPILKAIIADLDAARESADLAFYIWNAGGTADEVEAALVRAAARGVRCRVLLDAVGSKPFLASPGPGRLRAAGVAVVTALPVRLLGLLFRRADLRLHRKIVVVDERVAWTGSMNLVDPRFFKQDAGVGEWVDAMARLTGPAVGALRAVFLFDWGLQTGDAWVPSPEAVRAERRAVGGPALVQVAPSGPGLDEAANLRIIVDAIATATHRIVLTTPYFVPDASLAMALQNAAMRGVEVTIIVPARNDSRLVQHASRAFFDDLLAAGARLLLFDAGLLHTKSITVDGRLSLFGTVNLDMRSLHLNFELMLLVHDEAFTRELEALQASYARQAGPVDAAAWAARSGRARLLEGAASLVAPML